MIDSTGPRVSQAKESGQAADTVVEKNISKMWARVSTESKARGFWVYNPEVSPQLDGLYVPAGVAGVNPRTVTYGPDGSYMIKGRPAVEFKHCSALGDEGDIAFIDPTRYALISKDIEAAQSMHVRFVYGENAFRWMYPVNGRPVWSSAKTPRYGSSTISTFVTLAARA
jgi:HK97 family phage major capsid protein